MDTGVVRKIDELGRIVIPKEIRRNLNIRNGEDVSISVSDDLIILKKYEKALSIKEISQKYIDAFKKVSDDILLVSDKSKVISSTKEEYLGKDIDSKVFDIICDRVITSGYSINIGDEVISKSYYVSPIIVEGDLVGSVISLCKGDVIEKSKLLNSVLNVLICLNLC